MSKDKYRPSISVDEVVQREIPQLPVKDGGGTVDISPPRETVPWPGDAPENRTAPINLRIVSQKTYYSPEGQQFVEIVVAWDNVPDATEYLVRVGSSV